MRWRDSRRSSNVEDYRGRSFGVGSGLKLGLGGILVLVVAYFFGVDPREMLGLLESTGSLQEESAPAAPMDPNAPPDEASDFVSAVLGETEDVWGEIFQSSGAQYVPPRLALFTDQVRSACGFAQAASGPFYCPADQKVYIDLGFFRQLEGEFKAPGDFAQAYVLAHEVGHHVQNLLGTSEQVQVSRRRQSEEQANRMSVLLELQADCYAGVWAHHAERERQILEPGDIEEGLRAASAVGDDTIQRRMQGYVVPESFTHGTAQQRMGWFTRGLDSGSVKACDTFNARD
jgi:predicted metalloprotease